MFREIARKKQKLAESECIEILKSEKRGVLSVLGDGGYPYAVPMNYWYCEEDGHIYFHGGKSGHKIDALQSCDKVSFCVLGEGTQREGDWSLDFKSVIVFGCIIFVKDRVRTEEISRRLSYRFTQDSGYIENEIKNFASSTLCLELIPEHISGKTVNES